jgi:hypothetical protein
MTLEENVRVKAFNAETGELIGEYESAHVAMKKLLLPYNKISAIINQINRKDKTSNGEVGRKRGILHKKTGIKYKFERA